MSEREWFLWFIEKLPPFDPKWPPGLATHWLDCFMRLWRWGCRLTVEEAIEAYR